MVSERDRIIEINNYLEDLGIQVNIGKNKALGNKGLFKCTHNKSYRIDISNKLNDREIIPVLVHEFAHFLHYTYDNKLKSLEFIFGELNDKIYNELTEITVQEIPKSEAAALYETKGQLSKEIHRIANTIKSYYGNFKISEPNKTIERTIKFPAKYLLKYDRIKIFNKIYSVESMNNDFEYMTAPQQQYIILKSKQRALKRINSRISKLNKYYNEPSELFARFATQYFLSYEKVSKIAPTITHRMDEVIDSDMIPVLTKFEQILNKVKNY